MNNTINVNGMTSYYNSFIKSITSQTSVNKGSKINSGTVTGEKDSFISTLSSKVETASTIEGASTVSTKDMTLEEYKQYINDTISKYNIHSSHSCDSYAISISDEGFKAMQADPEYEKWVMDSIKGMLGDEYSSGNRALTGPLCCVCSFGASKAECRCLSWSNGYQNGTGEQVWEAQSKGSFWTKRAEQKKIQDRIDKKAAEKKELEEKWLQEAAEKRQAYIDFLNGDKVFKTNSISELNEFFQMPSDPKVAGILSAYEAGTFAGGGLM
jgi:hypothetical protein